MILAHLFRLILKPTTASSQVVRLTILSSAAGVAGLLLFSWWPYPVSAWLALLLYASFYMFLLRLAPAAALLLFPALAGVALTQFISGLLIEGGGYLSETKEMGSPTGGFLRLAIVYILFLGTAAIVVEHFVDRWKRNGLIAKFLAFDARPFMPLAHVLDICYFVAILYLVYVGLKNGFPLFTGVDRFDFAKEINDPIYISIMGNGTGAMVYISFMLALKRSSKFYRGMAASGLIISALLGDKFTEFVGYLGILTGPSLCRVAWGQSRVPIGKLLALGVAITCITMPLVFIVYGGVSDSSSGFEKMKDRMTLQGQLWFLADREVHDVVRFNADALMGDWNMITAADPSPKAALSQPFHHQGMAFMLLHFAPPSDANLRLETGVVYCLGLHAYLLEVLGWGGMLLVNFLLAGLVGLLLSGLLYSLICGRLLYMLFFSKFLTFWVSTLSVADLFVLLNWKSLAFLVIFLFYYWTDGRFGLSSYGMKFQARD